MPFYFLRPANTSGGPEIKNKIFDHPAGSYFFPMLMAIEVKDGAHLVLIANDSLPAYDADPESVEDLAAVVDALESLRAKS